MVRLKNTTNSNLKVSIGLGFVLAPGQEIDVRDEYGRDSLIQRLSREGILQLTSGLPEPKPLMHVSRYEREDPI